MSRLHNDGSVIGASEDADVLQVLVDNLREVLYVRDPSTGRMLFVTPAFEEIWGIPREKLYENPRVFVEAIVPEDRPKVIAALDEQDKNEVPFDLEYRIQDAAGAIRHIAARAFLVRRDGRLHRVVGLAWDLTARRKVEDELRELHRSLERQVETRTAELAHLLEEKDLLLRELNHRVKNNLQLVSSLLQLQADRTTAPEAKAVLAEIRTRVSAVAVAHDHLYLAGDVTHIVLDDYAKTITDEVTLAHGSPGVSLTARFDTKGRKVPIDRAIPFGLLLNELLTNAHRHAFPQGSGQLRVTLSSSDDTIELEVADDGVGFDLTRAERAGSLGLRLVRALTSQLDGKLALEKAPSGLTARVRFSAEARG